ncbi:hypothetical protein GCM10023149_11780 [Mucilaginibacter gynuensis]|uniref:Uncharacterized protein n=1 Tax=Mucilaginibacter gynuensis TaxID=1302236 RepID=A0ABP8G1A0_9SPHI
MKKVFSLFIVVVLAVTAVNAQTAWVTQKIDDKVSVKFPSAPKVENGVYRLKDKDSVGYALNIVDFQAVANLDSAALAPMKDTEEFAGQLKAGLEQSLQGIVLSDITIGKWKGYTTYSLTGNNAAKKTKLYLQMILIGSKMYSMSSAVPDAAPAAGLKNKDLYFTSATVK